MKNQTFGVEIEMYDISREKASDVVREYFHRKYGRFIPYTEHIGGCYDEYSFSLDGRKWKFVSDASIVSPTKGCEMVTPILRYEDLEDLQEIVRALRKAGAKSDPAHSCGVHIHVGGDGHTAKSLRNLSNMMSGHEVLIAQGLQLAESRLNTWCRPISQDFIKSMARMKPDSLDRVRSLWYSTQHCDDDGFHYNSTRYHMLNLHSFFTKGTIEFRLFQFQNPDAVHKNGLHAGRLKAYIQFCLAISAKAKTMKSAKSTPSDAAVENPAFDMRTWLIKIGLGGDEFATCRRVFGEALPGDSAWRYGRPARDRRAM